MITEIKKEVEIDSKQSCRVVASVLPSSPRPGATTPCSGNGVWGGWGRVLVLPSEMSAPWSCAGLGYNWLQVRPTSSQSQRPPENEDAFRIHFCNIRKRERDKDSERESACKCRGTGLTWLKIYSFFLFISFFFWFWTTSFTFNLSLENLRKTENWFAT